MVITPFGLDTPWSDRPATEFTLQAWSGAMIGLGRGYPDRAPVCVGGNVGEFMAGLYGGDRCDGLAGARRRRVGRRVDARSDRAVPHLLPRHLLRHGRAGRSAAAARRSRPASSRRRTDSSASASAPVSSGSTSAVMVGHPEWQEDRKLFANRTPPRARHRGVDGASAPSTRSSNWRARSASRTHRSATAQPSRSTDHLVARGSIVDGAPTPPWRFTPPTPSCERRAGADRDGSGTQVARV